MFHLCQLRAEISRLVPAVANGLSRAYQAGADEEHCGLEKVLICLLYCAEADTCCRFVYDVLGEMCVYEDYLKGCQQNVRVGEKGSSHDTVSKTSFHQKAFLSVTYGLF